MRGLVCFYVAALVTFIVAMALENAEGYDEDISVNGNKPYEPAHEKTNNLDSDQF